MVAELKILLFFTAVVTLVYFSQKRARERERRRIAEKLFERAEDLLKTNRAKEAAGALNTITCVICPTKEKFHALTKASKIVTREKFDDLHRRTKAKMGNKRACHKRLLSE